MRNQKVGGYQLLVYIAYGFFILLGLSWFLMTLKDGHFNFMAFFIVAAFGSQVYYRHIFTNLIFGILCLVGSVFCLMEVISIFDLMAKGAQFDGLVKSLIALSLLSIVMSGILIFSYTKLSFKDK
jgi:hypothetical protein